MTAFTSTSFESQILTPTPGSPAANGFRMPAEWEPHTATWLTWPRPEGISFPDGYEPIPDMWARMAKELSVGEEVHINVFSPDHEPRIRKALADAGVEVGHRVYLHPFPGHEPWCRDHGPIFIKRDSDKALTIVDWGYNAWGGKYPPYDLDDVIPQHVAKLLSLPFIAPGIVMEGGSIEPNGAGTLLTTEACLLNPNRNPHLTKTQIEQYLCDYLGIRKVLWLGDGIVGDDTDGHIDDLTRFVGESTVVTVVEEDPEDENYELLQENLRRLKGMTTADGTPLRVVELPMPGAIERDDQRLPASYANFYIGNEVVLLPTYRDSKNDKRAAEILAELFPTRRIASIDGMDLIWGLGSFHCVTQQQPA
ncbi:MAG: agmatine/peptidylarginine deiminase, partial [Candidatus Methylacidiphilales bacterium]